MEQRFTYLFKVCYWNEASHKKEIGYHCLEAYSFDEAASTIIKYYNGSMLSFVVDCLGETIISLNKEQYMELVKCGWRERSEERRESEKLYTNEKLNSVVVR